MPTEDREVAPDDTAARASEPAVTAARAAARLARQVTVPLADRDLSLPQYRVLAFLAEGGAAPSDLAGKLAVSRPSVTALMDGLVNRGLVERHRDPDDGRRAHHMLTGAGRAELDAADQVVAQRLIELARHLTDEESKVAIRGLELISKAIRSHREADAQ